MSPILLIYLIID